MMIKAQAVILVVIGSMLAACFPISTGNKTSVQNQRAIPRPTTLGPPPHAPPQKPTEDTKWVEPPEEGQ